MKITIVGTGYVGLVTGTCLAETGNDVICSDINEQKIDNLNNLVIPIYEPGLEELIKRNKKEGRLSFSSNVKESIEKSLLVFICVDTPSQEDGSPNMTRVEKVAQDIGQYINSYKIIVNKSTVPVGTGELVRKIINNEIQKRNLEDEIEFDIVSNPEFLKEGAAIDDFMKPDRVVIGTDNVRVTEIMKELYSPFVRNEHPILEMDIKSAEMTKYVANAFLATKISFINEMANLCELFDADISKVRKGIISDSRIGGQFLFPGVGFGGSCFPKDIKILNYMAKENNYTSQILESVNLINDRQKRVLVEKVKKYFNTNNLSGLTFGIWGLAFKPNTDDMREAPSIVIIQDLISMGAKVKVYDPEAIDNAKNILGEENILYCNNMYEALDNCDAMILVTEWTQFRKPDFDRIKSLLKNNLIFDGRNQYEKSIMKKLGFEYFCIGKN